MSVPSSVPQVAFLGLGLMGGGMARRLVAAGFDVTVYNRDPSKAHAFAGLGARVAATPREAVAEAGVVFCMVADDGASRAVWMGGDGALPSVRTGAVLVECGTVTVEWIRELDAVARARGCALLDAPVTGSRPQAEAGELNFLVGGPAGALETVRPFLAAMGRSVTALGPVGCGARLKLINNFVCGVQVAALAEALVMIERGGFDREQALAVLTDGAPGSPLVRTVAARMTKPAQAPNFSLRLMAKDLDYAGREARALSLELETAPAALALFRAAMAAGHGEGDLAAVIEPLRRRQTLPSPFAMKSQALAGLAVALNLSSPAQSPAALSAPAPAELPGKGLAGHDFFYAGESKQRKMFIVKNGAVAWAYDDPAGQGEISDAVLLSNGNVLLAHQFAVKLVSPDHTVLWNHDAPKGCEIHTAQPIGTERVLFVQNGDPALLKVVNIVTGVTEREFVLPVRHPKDVHGQFRHARLTAAGTLLVAHMDFDKVCEYDSHGKELWSFPAETPWGVEPLPDGNVLITDRLSVREVTRRGDVVWAWSKADAEAAGYRFLNLQLAWRLPGGNTLINNWANEWSGQIDKAAPTVQAVEVTPGKQIVWALRSWDEPDLGPATTIQLLDTPSAPENARFGDLR